MRSEILEKLNEIFCDVFDRSSIVINEKTAAGDIKGWDSLMHITLVAEVEEEFNIKFTMKEILEMDNVGEMIDIILKRAASV
ncbi:MAG: acyl carrier protein [Oscillospiraceae bacterium]